jgi:hypothetical protein
MANPNQVANKGKGKSNCQLKQKEWGQKEVSSVCKSNCTNGKSKI